MDPDPLHAAARSKSLPSFNWCGAGARTPATGGRSAARRHTAVRAEDVITALNLAPLIEEEAEQQGTVP
jgi:hypothetical protein